MNMKNNKKTLQWILVFHVFAYSFFFLLTSSTLQVLAYSVADWVRIDCGAEKDYIDPKTKLPYQSDYDRFVEYGEAHNIVSSNYTKEQIGNQLKTLKSFPKGKRNCYTLPITPGNKGTHYLVRSFFAYGNYDDKRTIPSFDLHIGVDYWATFNKEHGDIVRFEIIHVPTTDDELSLCLVSTGHGTPFISSLEVFPWQSSRYGQTVWSSLTLKSRSKLGMSEDDATYIRYADDIYGRSWFNRKLENSVRINTSSMAIDSETSENTYKLPKEVLSSAVESVNASVPLVINITDYNISFDYHVYLHFYDFVSKTQNHQQRKMVIKFSDGIDVSFALEHMKPTTLVRNIKSGDRISTINIASDSQLPAILNAYEIYRVFPHPPVNVPTDERDVAVIRSIKRAYGIKRISWQGDPCRPVDYRWEGLDCSKKGTPRITSINLSSSNLSGEIESYFSNFTELKALDLSNNNLKGEIPESLADSKKLNYINLVGNKLKGPIPKRLIDKKKIGSLHLRTDINDTVATINGTVNANSTSGMIPPPVSANDTARISPPPVIPPTSSPNGMSPSPVSPNNPDGMSPPPAIPPTSSPYEMSPSPVSPKGPDGASPSTVGAIVGGTIGGSAAVTGLALTLKFGLPSNLLRKISRQKKKEEDGSKDKNKKESTPSVAVRPRISESLCGKASDAIQEFCCMCC